MKQNISNKSRITPIGKFVFGMIFFLLTIALLEFILSFAGLEKYDREFMPKSAYPVFVPGEKELADYYVTSSHFRGYINDQHFLKEKPAGLTRIFVVGGSAAYGWPYTEQYGFTGYLRRALEQSAPGRFELVNAAGMSFGSHRVLDVLRDVVLFAPDLVIVYSGNNEYVERNVLPAAADDEGTAVAAIAPLFRQMEIYRAVRLVLWRAFPAVFKQKMKEDITDIRSHPDVERGSLGRSAEVDREVLRNYQNNLQAMQELLAASGVPGIFCTVPVNVGGWLPRVADPEFPSQAEAARWVELYRLKEEAFREHDRDGEAEHLQKMLAITPDDPGVLFNYGKTLWNLKKYRASYQALVRAKDLDVSPRRALSSFNGVIRSLAAGSATISLADLEQDIADRFFKGIFEEIFIDYCHFTAAGNKFIAERFLSPLNQALPGLNLNVTALKQLIGNDTSELSMPPALQGQVLYARALTLQNNGRLAEAEKTYQRIVQLAPSFSSAWSNLGNIYLDQGDPARAEAMYEKALQANPANTNAVISLADIYLQNNRLSEAEKYYRLALKSNPYLPAATVGLGNCAMKQKEYRQAIASYEKTLELGREDAAMRRNLGDAYLQVGREEDAVDNWRAALRLNPYDGETRKLVEKYSRMEMNGRK